MITDEPIPYTSTGPAMVNIFAATPKTNPSFLNSMAGDTTALANPVIGTTVPAPAKLAILSYTPIPVNNAPKKTIIIGSHIFASYSEMPKNFKKGMYKRADF